MAWQGRGRACSCLMMIRLEKTMAMRCGACSVWMDLWTIATRQVLFSYQQGHLLFFRSRLIASGITCSWQICAGYYSIFFPCSYFSHYFSENWSLADWFIIPWDLLPPLSEHVKMCVYIFSSPLNHSHPPSVLKDSDYWVCSCFGWLLTTLGWIANPEDLKAPPFLCILQLIICLFRLQHLP